MKKLLSLLLLLLAFALILSACAKTPEHESTFESESESESTELQTINGIWHSANSCLVLDLRDLKNVSYYMLKVGYYEYEHKMTADFTFASNKLTMKLEDGESFSWVFDQIGRAHV